MAEEQAEAKTAKAGLLQNKAVIVVAIVALQAAMAFALTKFLIQPTTSSGEIELVEGDGEGIAEAEARGVLVSLEEMIVSRNSGARPRYLRTTIAVEAADSKAAAEVEDRMAEFRDATIMTLSHHSVQDLLSFEGKEAVKAEIKDALKSLVEEGKVLNVYYSDFVVQ